MVPKSPKSCLSVYAYTSHAHRVMAAGTSLTAAAWGKRRTQALEFCTKAQTLLCVSPGKLIHCSEQWPVGSRVCALIENYRENSWHSQMMWLF